MKIRSLFLLTALLLTGCRDVRVLTVTQGTTPVTGPNTVAIVRSSRALSALGIRAKSVRFRHDFGVVLLMGPHHTTHFRQVIESINVHGNRVRIVAFEQAPADGGEPWPPFRTYTLWIVPNSDYHAGLVIDVVSPDGVPIASTMLQ